MDGMDGMDVGTPRLRDQAGGLNGYAECRPIRGCEALLWARAL